MSKHASKVENHREIPNWDQWRHCLAANESAVIENFKIPAKRNPLFWNLPRGEIDIGIAFLKAIEKPGFEFLSADFRDRDFALAYSAHRLIATQSDQQQWESLVDFLIDQIEICDNPCSLANQIRSIELPLAIAANLPTLENSDDLASRAVERFEYSMQTHVSAAGLLDSDVIEQSAAVAACWTRSRMLMDALGIDFSSVESNEDFDSFLNQLISLTRRNRTFLFSDQRIKLSKSFLETAQSFCRDTTAVNKLQLTIDPAAQSRALITGFDEIGVCCETANVAVLRDYWMRKSNVLAVRFGQQACDLQLSNGSLLFSGPVKTELRFDDEICEQSSHWSVVCWHQDDDVEFLELEADFGPLTLQRFFLLARDDQFCLIGDTVKTVDAGTISHKIELPISSQIVPMQETQNTEFYLKEQEKIKSLVMPLRMEEWMTKSNRENWRVQQSHLRLRICEHGGALHNSVFIDLSPKRSQKPRTWRQLSVAENLATCPSTEVVAFRIRVGKQQWIVYRSMKEPANRTFMGQNHCCELYVGRFNGEGDVAELLTVE